MNEKKKAKVLPVTSWEARPKMRTVTIKIFITAVEELKFYFYITYVKYSKLSTAFFGFIWESISEVTLFSGMNMESCINNTGPTVKAILSSIFTFVKSKAGWSAAFWHIDEGFMDQHCQTSLGRWKWHCHNIVVRFKFVTNQAASPVKNETVSTSNTQCQNVWCH
jgi:hypothetical protein